MRGDQAILGEPPDLATPDRGAAAGAQIEPHRRIETDLVELRRFLLILGDRIRREIDPLARAGWRAQEVAIQAEIRRLEGLGPAGENCTW